MASQLNQQSLDLLKQGIQYTEDADLQQQEILNNFIKFYTKISDLNDSQSRGIVSFKRQYEIEKARIAD